MSRSVLPAGWSGAAGAAANPAWAEAGVGRLREGGVDLDSLGPPERDALCRVLGASRAAANWVAHSPDLLEALAGGGVGEARGRAQYLAGLGAPAGPPEGPEGFFRRLRRCRRREMLRIVARETAGTVPVDVTAAEIAALAEACLEAALAWAEARVQAEHGQPVDGGGEPNRGCILGMGKLGGEELNLASDVDVVMLYRTAEGGTTGGPGGRLGAPEYFSRVVALVAEALGRPTEDGLVFRVDLNLRPEGRSGPLAQPLDDAVLYYQSWGQTWERAALLKARPVAGDGGLGREFLKEVEPFVFRRSLDYTTVEDIKEMKRRIDRSAARRPGAEGDLKLGRGGIREVEFFTQTLQLIHGGRLPRVRHQGTLGALARLLECGVIDRDVAESLARGYRVLRRAEHAVQALHFRQTQKLPAEPDELLTVARRLGFEGPEAVDSALAALEEVRCEVHAAYGRLAHGAAKQWDEGGVEAARALLSPAAGAASDEGALRAAGFRDPAQAREGLRLLREAPGHPSPRARRILERIGPFLLEAVRGCPDPDRALVHLGEFLAASGARAGYLSLLEENPGTARLLITLFGTSGFLSRYLIARPELLDELVLGTHAVREKEPRELAGELREALEACGDEEERLDALRRFRNAEFLRIALNELWGAVDAAGAARQVTRTAEACLEAACEEAAARLESKYGLPREDGGRPAALCVLGLGKLGGAELDYHSDLDVVFVYSGPGSTTGVEGRGLTNAEFFARLAQRLMGALSTRTREGIAFRIDARLRPSGRAGALVVSSEAFEEYHRGRGAQTWERQALIRLRPVAGDPALGRAVAGMVRTFLYGGPPAEDPRPEIARMRSRVEAELGREGPDRLDLKAGPGGLVDVEFAVQALQLLHGWKDESFRSPNTLEALEALRSGGIVSEKDGGAFAEGYRFLRRVEGRLRLLQERPTDALVPTEERLAELARGVGAADGPRLLEEVRGHRSRVRGAYTRVMGGGEA